MSTMITLTKDELLPYRTHGTRRRRLMGVGLPAGKGGLRFGALRTGALRTAADPTARKRASALPGCTTGEAPTTYFLQPRPAASLEALSRFAAATEEMAAARGQLASHEVRFGPQVMARSGLTLDLPARFLEQEFGQGKVARFEDVDFPAPLTHEPTRRFLSGTGLPEDGLLLQLDTEIPLPTLVEYCADEYTAVELPQGAGDLIRLGHLADDNSLVLDGRTGTILAWNEPEAKLHLLNTDVSILVFTLWLLHREKTIGKDLAAS